MDVSINIEHRGRRIEVSDSSEQTLDMNGAEVTAEWWDNGTPEELIDRVVAQAKAALNHKGK